MVREVTKSEIAREFQMDLFDSPLGGRVKNDRTLMVWSFFGLGGVAWLVGNWRVA